jgi:ADP-ribose pyrophosphatase YjhB (NUDIX family)
MTQKSTDWISIAQRIQAISRSGIAYAQNAYDIERYTELSEIAAALIAGPESPSVALAKELFAAEGGYATPKVDVRGAVFQKGRVLLIRESEDGCWTFPGGWAEVGQSAAESVEREVREESGFLVRAVKLLACWDRNNHAHPVIPFHAYKLLFFARSSAVLRWSVRKQPRWDSSRRMKSLRYRPHAVSPNRSDSRSPPCVIRMPRRCLTDRPDATRPTQ